jgi:hypothetical protein
VDEHRKKLLHSNFNIFLMATLQMIIRRVRKITESDYYLRRVFSVRPSVRMEQLSSHWTDFHYLLYLRIFRKYVDNNHFHSNLTRITGTLHEDLCSFVTISRSILLKMRNVSGEICRKNQNTHFTFNNRFSENRTVYEITWKNLIKVDRPQVTI